MARRSKKSKSPKVKRPGPAQMSVGMSVLAVEPDLSGMAHTYKIKPSSKPRIGGGIPGVGSKGAIRRSRSGK